VFSTTVVELQAATIAYWQWRIQGGGYWGDRSPKT